MKNLYIVILNWKLANETINCLKSLQDMRVPKNIKCNLLIVDNNSGGEDLKKLKDYTQSHTRSVVELEIIENKQNYGFAGGNNVGLKHAMNMEADYMIVLNNDTRVDENFASELIRTAESGKNIGIVSPKIYFEKGFEFHKERYTKSDLGKVIWSAGGSMDWDNVFGGNVGVDDVDKGQFDEERDLEFATGACFLITRKAILKTGFFDEKYFLYFEDVDLCKRLIDRGLKIVFSPKSIIWHQVSGSSGIGDDLNDYFITRNRLMFGMKYASKKTKFALARQALRFLIIGRKMQKLGVKDYLIKNFGKGSWKN